MHLTQCKQCVLVPQVSKLECGITSASWSQIKKKKKKEKKRKKKGILTRYSGTHTAKLSYTTSPTPPQYILHTP